MHVGGSHITNIVTPWLLSKFPCCDIFFIWNANMSIITYIMTYARISISMNTCKIHTAWKVSAFGVSLVCIFSYLDWIRRDIPIQLRTRKTPNTDSVHTVSEAGHRWCSYIFCRIHRKTPLSEFLIIFNKVACQRLTTSGDYHFIHWWLNKIRRASVKYI